MLKGILLSEYIPLTEVFDETGNKIKQDQTAAFPAVQDRITGPCGKGWRTDSRQLGLHESQLYSWRSKARLARDRSAVEERLLVENARLKRQLAEQSEELAIVKRPQRTSPRAWRKVRIYAVHYRTNSRLLP